MNEKELRKLLTEKQREMEAAQREYELVHYSRQLKVFGEIFEKSPEVLTLIQSEEMTYDDCRLLANIMSKKIRPIYKNFADTIMQNQNRRKNKNKVRNERRHGEDSISTKTTVTMSNTAVKPVTANSPSHANPQSHENSAEADGRQY